MTALKPGAPIKVPLFIHYRNFCGTLLTEEKLESLTTKRLLSYYKAKRKHLYSLYSLVTYCGDLPEMLEDLDHCGVRDYHAMDKYMSGIRDMLCNREHVPKKRKKKKK